MDIDIETDNEYEHRSYATLCKSLEEFQMKIFYGRTRSANIFNRSSDQRGKPFQQALNRCDQVERFF